MNKPSRPLYARKGERVTCESGHPICAFSRDAACGEAFDQSGFLCEWTQAEPVAGDTNVGCRTCGAPFYDGLALHFADGYRYSNPPYDTFAGRGGMMRPGLGANFNYGAV